MQKFQREFRSSDEIKIANKPTAAICANSISQSEFTQKQDFQRETTF